MRTAVTTLSVVAILLTSGCASLNTTPSNPRYEHSPDTDTSQEKNSYAETPAESPDALQNVTEALLACRFASPGVHVAMHNRLLKFPGVVKDRQALNFVKVE